MAQLVLQSLSGAKEITFVDAGATGDLVPNPNGRTILRVNNASASSITVSADAVVECDQGEAHNLSESVAAGKIVDVVLHKRLNSQTTGNVAITYSANTDVSVGCYEVKYFA